MWAFLNNGWLHKYMPSPQLWFQRIIQVLPSIAKKCIWSNRGPQSVAISHVTQIFRSYSKLCLNLNANITVKDWWLVFPTHYCCSSQFLRKCQIFFSKYLGLFFMNKRFRYLNSGMFSYYKILSFWKGTSVFGLSFLVSCCFADSL